jgi:hypothetical protein
MSDGVNVYIGAPDGQTAVSVSSADTIYVTVSAGFTGLGGGGGTNLSATRTSTTVTVNSDTGTDATIAAADGSNAGVMTSAMQTKLAGIETGAEVNDTASEILTKVLTVDGTGSGLDADLLDGNHASAFAAAIHTHAIGDVTGLQTALDGKAATVHTHAIGDVTGLQTALDGKAATVHTHAIGDVTGLQTALDAKVDENAAITAATKTKITYDAKGLVTAGSDATTADIADSSNRRYVTDAQQTVIGNTSGTNTGDQTITLTGDVTGSGTGSFAATIAADAVTNSKLANMATARFKARITAGSGDPEDLTGTQATTLLDTFTSSLKGLAPASGGGTTNFLRADGTWAAPAGGGGVSDGDKGDITVSSSGTVWTVDNDAVTYAKIQNVSNNNRLLGRATSGAGDVEEITIGSGLTLTGTTLSASGGGGGADGTVLSPSQITAWQNNYSPSGWASTVGVLRINSNQFHFLSGLTATTDGHTVRIFNTGTFPIGLYNQNTDSTAANRFSFDDHDVIILPQNSVELYYDGTASRWSLAAGWTLNSESQYVSKYWNEAFTTAGDNHGATNALWPASGGTATASAAGGVTGSRVGIVDLATGTGATGRAAFYPSATNTAMAYNDGTGKNYMEFRAEFRSPAALSDATNEYFIQAGFIDSVTSDSNDGAFLKYTHSLNGGQWQFLTADNSTRTTGNSTVAMAVNTWYCLRVVMYPNGTAEFYIDGVSLGRNTANLPGSARDFSVGIVLRKNAGTTARNMLVDGVGYTVVKYRK